MHRRQRRHAITVVLALTGGLLAAAPARAADLAPGYYKPAYTDTITTVQGRGAEATTHPTSFDEWGAAGYPAPSPSPTEYVKYPWAPAIYAVTYWPDVWQWDQLTGPEWQRAGYPSARTAGWVEGSAIIQYSSSDELFLVGPDDSIHKLTGPEWAATDFAPVDLRYDDGFAKRAWSDAILICTADPSGRLYAACSDTVGGEEWSALDRPTPRLVRAVRGDSFTQARGSADIYAEGPGLPRTKLTFAQWRAAGSPTPTTV